MNRLGLQTEIPAAKTKTNYENVNEVAVVVWRGNRVLLRQCREHERWAGLWDFLRFGVSDSGNRRRTFITKTVADWTGLTITLGKPLTTIRHGVTRFRITLDCYDAVVLSGRLKRSNGKLCWVKPDELEDFPLSVTGRKIGARLLSET